MDSCNWRQQVDRVGAAAPRVVFNSKNLLLHLLLNNCLTQSHSCFLIEHSATKWPYLKHEYSCFGFFSPDCTLHTAITDVISVLERRRHTHDYAIGIRMKLHSSNTFITWVTAECNVQSGLNTLKQLYSITPHITAGTVLCSKACDGNEGATPGTFWSLAWAFMEATTVSLSTQVLSSRSHT